MNEAMQRFTKSADVLFLMLGAVMIFSMHAGFAFLEVGTVRKKNQVNALVKIIADWGMSTVVYFLIGFPIAYGIHFWMNAGSLMDLINGRLAVGGRGFDLVRCFFLLSFAACVPAIISGGVAERMKFWPQFFAGAIGAGLIYPLFESISWGRHAFAQCWLMQTFGATFHDYAGSVVVHSMGGWLALPAIILLGQRIGRFRDGKSQAIPISNLPFLALGSWVLAIGWFGFNVMSAQKLEAISGLVAVNSLFAMVGGILAGLVFSKRDPGFIHNGALAGLIAICAGSDVVHPYGAFIIGAIASVLFITLYNIEANVFKIDDVLGVVPLHGVCGTWGGVAAGIFGKTILGGLGGVSLRAQIFGSCAALVYAVAAGTILYAVLKNTVGLRLSEKDELVGADIAIHNISAYPEDMMTP
ncbi:MAG: ammonium transporter [Chitinivibrionales bacterium]|nr:ammonium transporter [Chitinivibrionales bacterium]